MVLDLCIYLVHCFLCFEWFQMLEHHDLKVVTRVPFLVGVHCACF